MTARKQISFGWLAPSLSTQLAHTKIRKRDAVHFNRDRLAILRTHIRGYISDGERDKAMRKLIKTIERAAR